MSQNIQDALKELRSMTVTQLKKRYEEVFGEPCRSGNRQHLQRRIAWRIQALAEGDLPARAARLQSIAKTIADDADLRRNPPRRITTPTLTNTDIVRRLQIPTRTDPRLPLPGALLTRVYKSRRINVRVLPNGFDFEGAVFRSLSAIAKEITGSHWSGPLFFGLKPTKKIDSKEQAA